MKKKVHIVPHTHWDREWYFNTSRSTIYLIKHMKEVLGTLEGNEEYSYYLLDGQTSLLDDYLEYYPEDLERIQKLVKDGRLITGPWVTQTDQLVISQESIVRNLLYGVQRAKEFGKSLDVGYVPDAFGQGGNMPQIYNSFGINYATFWRGVADNTVNDTDFIWEGTDGSKVISHIMRNGYSFGGKAGIPEDKNMMKEYLEEFVNPLEEMTSSNHIYFPYGHDQSEIRKDLPNLITAFNEVDKNREYILNSLENYFAELEKDEASILQTVRGELTQAKHSRIHKSIFSTRADMKILNNKIENFITNVLEPTLVLADSLGIQYPHAEIEKIWMLMFESAAHDSIGGCNSDSTNRDILDRYKKADDLGYNLLEITIRQIANRVKTDGNINFIIFNPLPYKTDKVVEIEAYIPSLSFNLLNVNGESIDYVIEDYKDMTNYVRKQIIKNDRSKPYYLPENIYRAKIKLYLPEIEGLGYTTIQLEESNEAIRSDYQNDSTIENEYYKIKVNTDNTLDIYDKESKETLENQMIFVESGDDGDSYNYSPPRKDLIINSNTESCERVKLESTKNDVESKLNLVLRLKVPSDLEARSNKVTDCGFEIETVITLRKNEKLIRFNSKVDNNVLSHKLSVQFDAGFENKYSYADQLFGPIKRLVELPELEIWEEESWEEKPISIEPMQNYAALSTEEEHIAVLTKGVREYEIVGESFNKLQLTLFRTFGQMGRENLLFRPGRSSGETIVKTPDAQLIGELEFEYALYFDGSKPIEDSNLSKVSKEYLTELPIFQKSDFINGRMFFVQQPEVEYLSKEISRLEVDSVDIGISAVKKSEDNNAVIMRIFNPYINKDVTLPSELTNNSTVVELDEKISSQQIDTLSHNKFVTLRKEI